MFTPANPAIYNFIDRSKRRGTEEKKERQKKRDKRKNVFKALWNRG
jgi:hypothetical protein